MIIRQTVGESELGAVNSGLVFFEPWMALIGTLIMFAAIILKRRYPLHSAGSLLRRILIVSAIYFIPAALGWLFLMMWALRVVAEKVQPVPGIVATLCASLGTLAIAGATLGPEIGEARRMPPRW
jgi:hypothetical protein